MLNKELVTKRVAIHESGHAVVAYLLHHHVGKIRVFANKYDYYGLAYIYSGPEGRTVAQCIEEGVLIDCAGNAAEYLLTGRKYWSHYSGDYLNAVNSLSWLYGSNDEIEAGINFLWLRAKNMLAEPANWYIVKYLALDIEGSQQACGYWDEDGRYCVNEDYEDTCIMEGYSVQYTIEKAMQRYRELL